MANNLITIDGPSGAGKSTIARLVAMRLGLRYLDTGAMYRAITLACMRAGIRLNDAEAVAAVARQARLRCELSLDQPMKVFLGNEDVSDKIRTPEVTRNIHYVADVREVRDVLVEMQRKTGENEDLVTEGRDQGTVVFPNASLKIYMFALPEVRARRRHKELVERGQSVTYEEVLQDVSRRDYLDMDREVGALRKARDAVEIDTSELTPEQTAEEIVRLAKSRLAMRTRKLDKGTLDRLRKAEGGA